MKSIRAMAFITLVYPSLRTPISYAFVQEFVRGVSNQDIACTNDLEVHGGWGAMSQIGFDKVITLHLLTEGHIAAR